MYYLFLIVKAIVSFLPRKVNYWLARRAAWLKCVLPAKDKRIVRSNLSLFVKDPKTLKKYTRRVFENFCYYMVDFFNHQKLTQEFIENNVTVTGREYVDQALAAGKGVIALTAHLGNYELGGAVISMLGYNLHVVALAHNDPRANRLFDAQREVTGVKVIPAGVAVKRCLRVLKEANPIAFVGDRDFSGGGKRVKMFSKYAVIPRGPAFFALKAKAVVVPTLFIREGRYRYRLIFDKPLYDGEQPMTEDALMDDYAALMERYISQYPDQWYMFIPYWYNEDGSRII